MCCGEAHANRPTTDHRNATPRNTPRKRTPEENKKGFPGALRPTGTPGKYEKERTFRESHQGLDRKVLQTVECGGALLSHTLSSAVPSPQPGLSFRVRKGTGRLTWAMTTAKPL